MHFVFLEEEEQKANDVAGNVEAENDEDDAVVEEPIIKEEPTIPSKVKSCQIPADYPHDQVVHVNKLPKCMYALKCEGVASQITKNHKHFFYFQRANYSMW